MAGTKIQTSRLSNQVAKMERKIARLEKANAKLRGIKVAASKQPKKLRPWQDKNVIGRLRSMGFSDAKIADAIGCSIPTANKYRHHFGFHDSLCSTKWGR